MVPIFHCNSNISPPYNSLTAGETGDFQSKKFMSVSLKCAYDTYPSANAFYLKKRQVRFLFDFVRSIRLNTVSRDKYRVNDNVVQVHTGIAPIYGDAKWRQ